METVMDRTEAQLRFGNALMASPAIAAVLRKEKKLSLKKGDDRDTEYVCIFFFSYFQTHFKLYSNTYFVEGIVLDLDQEIIPVHRFLDKITPLDLLLQIAKKVNFIYCISLQI